MGEAILLSICLSFFLSFCVQEGGRNPWEGREREGKVLTYKAMRSGGIKG